MTTNESRSTEETNSTRLIQLNAKLHYCCTITGIVDTLTWSHVCIDGTLDQIERCIMLGTDVNMPMGHGPYPLHMWARWGPLHFDDAVAKTQLLLHYGANVHLGDDAGDNALQLAAARVGDIN